MNSIDVAVKQDYNGHGIEHPAVLYNSAVTILSKTTGEAVEELYREFHAIHRSKFTTLHAYRTRALELRRKIDVAEPGLINEKGAVYTVMGGLNEYHWHEHLVEKMQSGTLTWTTLMETINRHANAEAITGPVTLVRVQKPTVKEPKDGDKKKEKVLHKLCGKYHKGGDDRCFKLHPELAEEWRKSKGLPPRGTEKDEAAALASKGSTRFASGIHGAQILLQHPGAVSAYELNKDSIILDSGASAHTFNDMKWFKTLRNLDTPMHFASACGGEINTTQVGIVSFDLQVQGKTVGFDCEAVYSPLAPCNLMSQGQLREDGALFDGSDDTLKARTGQLLAKFAWTNKVAVF